MIIIRYDTAWEKDRCDTFSTLDEFWMKHPRSSEAGYINSITLSGRELDWAKTNFVNLPCRDWCRPVTWHGDMAKFVYANLHQNE